MKILLALSAIVSFELLAAAPRLLDKGELAKAKALVGDSLTPEQSFAVTLKPLGDVWFVAETLLPPESFRYRIVQNGKEIAQFAPDKELSSWTSESIEAVTFKDFDGDGIDDVGVVAAYITGAGPEGTVPFSVPEVYRGNGKTFVHDAGFAKKIEAAKVKNMKGLLKLAAKPK